MGAIPTLSLILALILKWSRYVGYVSGFIYMLYMPAMFAHGFSAAKQRQRLLLELNEFT